MEESIEVIIARIDERTRNMAINDIARSEIVDKRLDAHSASLKSLEMHKNILHGAWLVLSALFGKHTMGH